MIRYVGVLFSVYKFFSFRVWLFQIKILINSNLTIQKLRAKFVHFSDIWHAKNSFWKVSRVLYDFITLEWYCIILTYRFTSVSFCLFQDWKFWIRKIFATILSFIVTHFPEVLIIDTKLKQKNNTKQYCRTTGGYSGSFRVVMERCLLSVVFFKPFRSIFGPNFTKMDSNWNILQIMLPSSKILQIWIQWHALLGKHTIKAER